MGKVRVELEWVAIPAFVEKDRRNKRRRGGIVQFNDCGNEKSPNLFRRMRACPVDKYGLIPDDGKAWEKYNDALMKLKPLSRLDLKRGWKVAAYNANYKEDGITEKKEEIA